LSTKMEGSRRRRVRIRKGELKEEMKEVEEEAQVEEEEKEIEG